MQQDRVSLMQLSWYDLKCHVPLHVTALSVGQSLFLLGAVDGFQQPGLLQAARPGAEELGGAATPIADRELRIVHLPVGFVKKSAELLVVLM